MKKAILCILCIIFLVSCSSEKEVKEENLSQTIGRLSVIISYLNLSLASTIHKINLTLASSSLVDPIQQQFTNVPDKFITDPIENLPIQEELKIIVEALNIGEEVVISGEGTVTLPDRNIVTLEIFLTNDGITIGEPADCSDFDEDGFKDQTCGGYDCNDRNSDINPDAIEECDSIDNNCDGEIDEIDCGFCRDSDGDDYKDVSCGGDDCDDTNENINPGKSDICGDGIDNDCDGKIDIGCYECVDEDGDDWPRSCDGTITRDCDDNDPDISPGASEICDDGKDNDCDEDVDLDDSDCFLSCQDDVDEDGFIALNCNGSDCNDNDSLINPDAIENCSNGIDDDCDGNVDFALVLPKQEECESDMFGYYYNCKDDAPNINDAINNVRNGCTIKLATGTYYIDDPIKIENKSITLMSETGDSTIVMHEHENNTIIDIDLSSSTNNQVEISGLVLDGNSKQQNGILILAEENDQVIVRDCEIKNNDDYFTGGYSAIYIDFEDQASDSNMYIINNLIHDNSGQSIFVNLLGGETIEHNILIANNTIDNNGSMYRGGGIYIKNLTSSNITIANNIISNSSGDGGLFIENNYGALSVTYNGFFNNKYYLLGEHHIYDCDSSSGSAPDCWVNPLNYYWGNLICNPDFDDLYFPNLLSFCVDAGTVEVFSYDVVGSLLEYDKAGTQRPQGLSVDLGAYEVE